MRLRFGKTDGRQWQPLFDEAVQVNREAACGASFGRQGFLTINHEKIPMILIALMFDGKRDPRKKMTQTVTEMLKPRGVQKTATFDF